MINKDELKNALKLYLVTDSDILKGRNFYKCIEDAIKAGVTMVQLREKNADGKEFLEKAIKLRQITKKYNVTFVINDRVDIAMIADADGVHVGQSDIDALRWCVAANFICAAARQIKECSGRSGIHNSVVKILIYSLNKIDQSVFLAGRDVKAICLYRIDSLALIDPCQNGAFQEIMHIVLQAENSKCFLHYYNDFKEKIQDALMLFCAE